MQLWGGQWAAEELILVDKCTRDLAIDVEGLA